ncbi:Holliday junction recognition protein isoform X2 [Dermochelys coriacea]|uniref:Holliday junction recognition protein isoform X2 n=1 Tax=Dermochelys coriacea TaxID=27794 RepID=UPI001CA7C502|nr:Holliday junction recognition protein isoform X2 [Dermochelys coriacea]
MVANAFFSSCQPPLDWVALRDQSSSPRVTPPVYQRPKPITSEESGRSPVRDSYGIACPWCTFTSHHLSYNYPFEDDILVSMESLTYDTPIGPQLWGDMSEKNINEWKKKLHKRATQCQKITESRKQWISDFEDEDLKVHQEPARKSFIDSYEEIQVADTDTESEADLVSIRRKFENVNLKEDILLVNPSELEMREKVRVRVDVIVQDDERNIPKWIMVAPGEKSKRLHVTSPWQDLMGMTKSPVDKITVPRHVPFLEKNETGYDSFMEEYQSANEECSWNNVTLADLYPGMVETLSKLMNKHSQKKAADSIIRHYKYRGWPPRKSKLNVTIERIRRFRTSKLKPMLPNTNSNDHKLPVGNNLNESNQLVQDGKCPTQCVTNGESGVVSYPHVNTSEMEIDWPGNLEDNSYIQRIDQNISESVFPNVTARTEETFLTEGPSQTTMTLHDSKGTPNEKLPEVLSLGCSSVTCTTSSCLMKESKNGKIDNTASDGTSGFHLSTCNLNGDANTFPPLNNYSLVRTSNALVRNPEIKTFRGGVSLQRSHSFSSLPVNQSPVKTRQKCEEEFEKLYQKLCPKELQKPLKIRKPPSNPKEKERLIKSYFCNSVKSHKKCDSAFDEVYQRLCSEGFPKLPTFLRASNLRKYEGIQMSKTVNALINSPIRTLPAVTRIKRVADFHNEDLLSSPVKRLKNIPEDFFPRASNQSPHRKNINPQTTGLDFSSVMDGIVPGIFDSPNCQSQASENFDSGFHTSSDHTFPVSPSIFVQGYPENSTRIMGERKAQAFFWEDFIAKDTQGAFLEGYRENIIL